jgi:predicted  nucleic acid-binding Zn-ribbon protein
MIERKAPSSAEPTIRFHVNCGRRAFEYFVAAEETDDQKKRDALLEGGQKWLRLAAEIEHDTRRRGTSLRNAKGAPV